MMYLCSIMDLNFAPITVHTVLHVQHIFVSVGKFSASSTPPSDKAELMNIRHGLVTATTTTSYPWLLLSLHSSTHGDFP